MSARLNLSIGIGTLAVMLIMSFGNLYFTNQGKEQSEQNARDIEYINATLTDFIKDRNIAFNQTFSKINTVTQKTNDTFNQILDNQEKNNIRGNITGSYLDGLLQTQIRNEQQIIELANQTKILISQFNQTNEVERAKAVNRIIDGINNNTKLLEQLLDQQNLEYTPSGGIASIK